MKILAIGTNSKFTSGIYIMFPTTRTERPTIVMKKTAISNDLDDSIEVIQLQSGVEITDEDFITTLSSKFVLKEHNALGALFVRKPVTLKRVLRKRK
jgi:hypothetical protein